MSDPVSNTEIEDVLTSIRRLVSENRPLPETADREESETDLLSEPIEVPAEKRAPVEAPLALVLTPALRVEDEPDVADEALYPAEVEAESEVTFDDAEERIVLDESAVGASITDAPSEEYVSDFLEEESEEIQEVRDEFLAEPESFDATEETVDVEEAQVTDAVPAVQDVAPEEAVDEEQPFDFKRVLETRIHQFRDATHAEEVAPDRPENVTPDMAEVVMDELRVTMPDQVAQTIDAEAAETLAVAMEEATEIDEAMLREMVSDIVRQELQGALGERITRNVRKLVRREIHRALAAHDLG